MRCMCVVGVAALAGMASTSVAVVSVQPVLIQPVAVSGGSAPGGGTLVYGGLGTFGLPRLNNLGESVFTAQLSTSGTSGTFLGSGVWGAVPQSSRLVFLQGGTVATGSGSFPLATGFLSPTINDSGNVATTCNGAVLVSAGGVGQVAIQNGDPIASPAGSAVVSIGGQFEFGSNPLLNNAGQIAVRIGVAGAPADSNLLVLSGAPGALTTRLGSGPAPALGSGMSVTGVGALKQNSPGAIASAITVSINGGNSLRAITRVGPGGPELVALQGGQIPGQAAGAMFTDLPTSMAFNDQGAVAFAAHSTGFGGVTEALFVSSGAITSPVATRGQAAPGLPGLRFGGGGFFVLGTPSMNATGRMVFQAQLQTTGGQDAGWGVFAGDAGGLSLVASSGGDAGFGQTFQDNSLARSIMMNDLGEVAMVAPVSSTQVALFATDLSGLLHRIIAQGDSLQVSPGVFKQVSLLRLQASPNENGIMDPHVFNNLGQIAFFARFTDNTEGIFRATVPAPSTLGVVAAGWVVSGRRRRRR